MKTVVESNSLLCHVCPAIHPNGTSWLALDEFPKIFLLGLLVKSAG